MQIHILYTLAPGHILQTSVGNAFCPTMMIITTEIHVCSLACIVREVITCSIFLLGAITTTTVLIIASISTLLLEWMVCCCVQRWFKLWWGTVRQQAITRTNIGTSYKRSKKLRKKRKKTKKKISAVKMHLWCFQKFHIEICQKSNATLFS